MNIMRAAKKLKGELKVLINANMINERFVWNSTTSNIFNTKGLWEVNKLFKS